MAASLLEILERVVVTPHHQVKKPMEMRLIINLAIIYNQIKLVDDTNYMLAI